MAGWKLARAGTGSLFQGPGQEFDVHTLDSLIAGQHTLSVLVQYAPNVRRSGSSQPALQASLRAWDGDVGQTSGKIDTERPE